MARYSWEGPELLKEKVCHLSLVTTAANMHSNIYRERWGDYRSEKRRGINENEC